MEQQKGGCISWRSEVIQTEVVSVVSTQAFSHLDHPYSLCADFRGSCSPRLALWLQLCSVSLLIQPPVCGMHTLLLFTLQL